MQRNIGIAILVVGCVLVTACAAGDARFTGAHPAGFWHGIWHGIIAPIAFIVGLFRDGVQIYERSNTGSWYDFGYLLGIGCLGGGGHRSHRWWRDESARRRARVTIDIT